MLVLPDALGGLINYAAALIVRMVSFSCLIACHRVTLHTFQATVAQTHWLYPLRDLDIDNP